MKAAIVTAFDPYVFRGGIERYTLQLIALLKGQGIEADVYHTGMVRNEFGLHDEFLGKAYALGRHVITVDRNYDIVISNSYYGMGYFPPSVKTFNIYHSNHAAFGMAIEEVVSHIAFLHVTNLYGYLGEMASGFGRIKIAVSQEVGTELERHYGFEEIRVVESGIDISAFRRAEQMCVVRRKYSVPDDAYVGLFVGRWDKTKGSDIIEKVIGRTPDILWVLALGSGSCVCELEEMRNVLVLNEVPHEDMPDVYSLADFMFFPSRYEGFGLVIIEAMACGLPVFSGEIGVAKKIYAKEVFAGVKLPDFSLAMEDFCSEAVKRIYSLRSDEEMKRHISGEGLKIIREEYSLDLWKERMLKALELD